MRVLKMENIGEENRSERVHLVTKYLKNSVCCEKKK